MYTTIRNIAGGTFMTCNDCGEAISLNKLCEAPLQSATNMLKHMAGHNASRAFAVANRSTLEAVALIEPATSLDTVQADCVEASIIQSSPWSPETGLAASPWTSKTL
jgi:hypothetical protein